MIRWRCTATNALPVTTRPLFAPRAKAAMARSISETSRTLTGLTSTPSDGAMDWMAANWAGPEARGAKDSRRRHGGRDVHEQLPPVRDQAVFEGGEAGGIAARPCEAVDKAGAHRIGDDHEHDRHAARRLQHRRGPRIAGDENDMRSPPLTLGNSVMQSIRIRFSVHTPSGTGLIPTFLLILPKASAGAR